MNNLRIEHLNSGGLITNYYCTSRCMHCLYGCSPHWEKVYIDPETTRNIFKKVLSLGCRSVHIGGGEPLLNLPNLLEVANIAGDTGISIEYVETNSSWYQNEKKAIEILKQLMSKGIKQLLVSISPFHNVYIPFFKVKGLLNACRQSGMRVFPWVMDFFEDIDAFDDQTVHSLAEYVARYGNDYLRYIPSRYWVQMGGRAIETYKEILPLKTLERIVESPPCPEITDTGHFHIDLFRNYIPGLCSGFAIKMEDLGEELSELQYPLLTRIYNGGIRALLEHACKEYGFIPQNNYLNKCHLCNDIRMYLVNNKKLVTHELKPQQYYEQVKPDNSL